MSFRVLDALPILCFRFGETINKVPDDRTGRKGYENKKVMGFRTPSEKVLALDVYPSNMGTVRMWIEPPAPPRLPGVSILDPKKCADLDRNELRALSNGSGIYVEIPSGEALDLLITWYK